MHRYINARVVSGSAFIFSGLGDSPLPNRAAFSSGVAVRPMHRLNLEGMIPEEGATLIAVSTLLPGASQARKAGATSRAALANERARKRKNLRACRSQRRTIPYDAARYIRPCGEQAGD